MKKSKKAVKRKSKKAKSATAKPNRKSCDDCGYSRKDLHDDCPMCEECPRCSMPLMQCECKESE